jgi:hypothetical protein
MRYSGFVRAKENCHVAGDRHSPGDVFTVNDMELWSDDPFEAVKAAGTEEIDVPGELAGERRLITVTKYERSDVSVSPAIKRMPPDHRAHAGVRKDA